MLSLEVKSSQGNYDVLIKKGLRKKLAKKMTELARSKKIALLIDEKVYSLYGEELLENLKKEGFQVSTIRIKGGEKHKNWTTLHRVYEELVQAEISRWDQFLVVGGGVVGDLGGFAAASYLRGLPYVQVPTTLLAQVDSSVGGKVAIDLAAGKNLVGAFYPAQAVLIDPDFLETLAPHYFNDGLAEIIKYGCLKEPALLEDLAACQDQKDLLERIEKIIYTSLAIKKSFVEEDELDQGARMHLNFGHTLGHGLESYYKYEKYSHGQAVAIGMAITTKRSEELSLSKAGTSQMLNQLLEKYNLPTNIPREVLLASLPYLARDKKSNGQVLQLVLIEELGTSFLQAMKPEELTTFFKGGH